MWVKIGDYFVTCDLEIWWMTSETNRAPLLYYITLCASFEIHRWIQAGVTDRKHSIEVKVGDFLSRLTLKFNGWPWKTIGHPFYDMLSFVHYFKLKLKLVRKRSYRVKIGDYLSRVTLKFDGWKIIGHLFYTVSSFIHHFVATGEFKLELQSRNAQFGSKSTIF